MRMQPYWPSIYLAACLLLGGSSQGVWSNLLLQVSGLVILLGLAAWPNKGAPPRSYRWLQAVLIAAVGWSIIQLIPLPPAVWTALPGRQILVEGYRLVGHPLPWLAISISPERTISALLALLPPAAMFALTLKVREPNYLAALLTILLVSAAAIFVGVLQKGGVRVLYFYPISNVGASTGFFANSNHMGALILTSIPFLAAGVATLSKGFGVGLERSVGWALAAILIATVLVGLITNGSLAVLLLGGPVILASFLLLVPAGLSRLSRMIAITGAIAAIAIPLALTYGNYVDLGQVASIATRQQFWKSSVELGYSNFPVGTGLGTFISVFPLSENPDVVDWVFVNHAHNDYIEFFLELGAPGLIIAAAFLLWWATETTRLWTDRSVSLLARSASISSGALLLHSVVDYPLRTPALASLFAFCLVLIIRKPRAFIKPKAQARHLTLDQI